MQRRGFIATVSAVIMAAFAGCADYEFAWKEEGYDEESGSGYESDDEGDESEQSGDDGGDGYDY